MGLINMELPDLEKLFDEKLSSVKLQITHLNSRMDNQVKTLQFLIGGIVFPLIVIAVTTIVQKLV